MWALNAPSKVGFFAWKAAREKIELLELYVSRPGTKKKYIHHLSKKGLFLELYVSRTGFL